MMTKWFGASLVFLLVNRAGLAQDDKRAVLEATVRKLEKQIADVRGKPFKHSVAAKLIPRPPEVSKGVQGYYSLKDKALFIYDDISGAYERGVLIHEMMHAWQDQHFGLAQLHQGSFDSEAELALAALIEGDATFTMIEMLQKEQPAVTKMLATSVDKAKNRRNAFLYGQGARYVQARKERGGWAAVDAAYRNPPKTTAAIFFPETIPSVMQMGPGKSKGAFGIVDLLAAHPETAAVALASARAWRGDRFIEDKDTQAWTIAFATPKEARAFQQASAKLRKAQNPKAKALLDRVDEQVLQEAGGPLLADLALGTRVLMLKALTPLQLQKLRDRIESPPLAVWSFPDKRFLSFGQFVDRLAEADLICVGETHDSYLHHHVQLRIIKGLFANDERLGVGLEMFQRPFQAALDRYVRGESAEDVFLKESEYYPRWGFEWGLYRPILEFSRKNQIPVAALNVPRELTQRLVKVGHDGLSAEEKAQLGDIDFHVKPHRDYWLERLAKLHGKKEVPAEQKERSYQVMAAWDGFMADSAARFQKERGLRRMAILAGSGHIDRGFGIPARAAKLTGGKAVTVRIEIGAIAAHAIAEPVSDYIVFVEPKSLTFHAK